LVGSNLENTNMWGAILVATFKVSDLWAFELGGGYTETINDLFVKKDNEYALYANAVITLAPGWFIVPEIGYFDYQDAPTGGNRRATII